MSPGRSCERGRVPSLWEASSLVRRSAGQKGSLRGLDKSAATSLQQVERRERDLHRWSASPCCTPQPKMHVCWCAEELSAETQASGDRPGGRTGVGCAEPAWRGYSVGQTANRGCFQKEPRSEALLLTGTQRQGKEPRHSRLTLGVLTAGAALLLQVWEHAGARRLPTHGSRAKIRASPQGPYHLGSRAEIWVLSPWLCDLWIFATAAAAGFVNFCGISKWIKDAPIWLGWVWG